MGVTPGALHRAGDTDTAAYHRGVTRVYHRATAPWHLAAGGGAYRARVATSTMW